MNSCMRVRRRQRPTNPSVQVPVSHLAHAGEYAGTIIAIFCFGVVSIGTKTSVTLMGMYWKAQVRAWVHGHEHVEDVGRRRHLMGMYFSKCGRAHMPPQLACPQTMHAYCNGWQVCRHVCMLAKSTAQSSTPTHLPCPDARQGTGVGELHA